MKRFWKHATYVCLGDRWQVLLDGRPMRLPGGPPLAMTNEALAAAIAGEWERAGGEGGEMSFDDVPLTRLAGTAQERIAPDPVAMAEALARYAEHDLLCYRAERPEALAEAQARAWQPLLDWATLAYDAPLRVGSGVMPLTQPPEALAALRRALATRDAATLAGLGIAVPALGSLVLGLALADGRLDAEAAHRLATLDERFQEELWGIDAEAAARRRALGADVVLAARFMALSRAAAP